METLNCLIVEDEPLAASLMEEYIRRIPGLVLKSSCEDVLQANEVLRGGSIDLVFLDINLPGMSGIDFLKTVNRRFDVILTTAYHEYALESYNLDVADYLLKPIEFSRFLQAVNKVYARRPAAKQVSVSAATDKSYFFNTDKRKIKVYAGDIVYIESLKDYVKIHTLDRSILTRLQIGGIDAFLDDERFVRIHKSYMVNTEKITAYGASEIELGNIVLPLGRSYKELVALRFKI